MPTLFVQQTALSNVGGRINYISSTVKQEFLLAYHDGAADAADGAYWNILAQECQESQKHAATDTKMCQGRELIIPLSNALLQRMEPEQIAKTLATEFEKTYHRPCAVAIHFNHDRTNLHAHLIYSERTLLKEPEVKVAPRKLFFDEQGKRCYKKGEVLGEDGQLRPGCKIVNKGEIYERRYFSSVDPSFSSKAWLKDCKTNWVLPLRNGVLKGDVEIKEFDPKSGKLPQQKVGALDHIDDPAAKAKAARIEEYNRNVREFNGFIDQGKVPPETAKKLQQAVTKASAKNPVLAEIVTKIRSIIEKHRAKRKSMLDQTAPATPVAAVPANPEPTPVPSFAPLIAADAAVEKDRKAVQQAKASISKEREVDYGIIALPGKLRAAVSEIQRDFATKTKAQEELKRIPAPREPQGIIVSKKKKAEYEAAYAEYREQIKPYKSTVSECQSRLEKNLDFVMTRLRPEERQKQGYGYDAPNMTAGNLTVHDVTHIQNTINFKLDHDIGWAARSEERYAADLEKLHTAQGVLAGSQKRFDAELDKIPPEHREKALEAVAAAREQRAKEKEAEPEIIVRIGKTKSKGHENR